MPDEKPGSQQAITSGEAFGNMTVHNHAPPAPRQSLIERELIRKYDPESYAIIRVADDIRFVFSKFGVSHGLAVLFVVMLLAAAFFYLMHYLIRYLIR
jgi:hypothetical protein